MQTLKLSQIKADPTQPRQEFDPKALDLLKKSIASQGILQPLVVEKIKGNGHYLLVDGERRFRASTQLGLKEVPVEIVNPMSDVERMIRRFHLQEQHRNWSTFDKARAIRTMIERGDMKAQEVGEVLGISNKSIVDMLSLLNLSNRTQELVENKRVPYAFTIRINRLVRATKDQNLRPKIEKALIDRLVEGKLKRMEEIDDYMRAVRKRGDKIIRKIVKSSAYTSGKALAESGADDIKIVDSIRAGSSWMEARLVLALDKKGWKLIDATLLSTLKRIHSKLGALIDKAS